MFRLLLCACLAWGVAPAPAGQSAELEAVSARIRSAIEARQSEFIFQREAVGADRVFQRWAHGAERVEISIATRSSAAEAVEWMKKMPNMVAAPLGEGLPLPEGIGDAGYLYARVDRGGRSIVHFVKGERFAVVSGPGVQIPTWFARIVGRELP
jgi:hypothetical protein